MENGMSCEAGEQAPNSSTESDVPVTTAHLRSLTEDDCYNALKRNFLMHGKGRRPDLPQVHSVTHGLLIRLYFLKEEGNFSFLELKTWLEMLVPDTKSVTEGRISHRIRTIIDSCLKMTQDQVKSFLLEDFDFHFLSPPLAALGLNRLHITDNETYPLNASEIIIKNEVVVALEHFRFRDNQSPIFVRKWLKTLSLPCSKLSEFQIRSKIQSVLKQNKKFLNRKMKLSQEYVDFLNSPFIEMTHPRSMPAGTVAESLVPESCLEEINNLVKNLEHANSILSSELQTIKELNESLIIKTVQQSKQILELESFNANFRNKFTSIKKQRDIFRREIKNTKKSSLYKQNFLYKQKLMSMTKEKNDLLRQVKVEKSKNNSLSGMIDDMKLKIKQEQSLKSKYKNSLREQKQKNSEMSIMLLEDKNEKEVSLRDEGSSHRFSQDLRQTYYALQGEANVAAGNCSTVIETVAKHLFKSDFKENLPCNSTSLNFASEAHIVAKHQATCEILDNKFFTYANDGTSRQKSHFLEQHIILSNGKQLSLGFSEIACDNSQTLLEKCVSLFKDLCEVYCLDNDAINVDELLKDLIKKLKCLLSDRAAVMKAFDAKMAKFKDELLEGEDSSTHFLFCNAHFLLALSASAESAIHIVEEELMEGGIGNKLGRDSKPNFSMFSGSSESAAIRLIRTAADVLGPRGDEKSGCRQEWLSFCSSRDVKSSFTSYRSNRFNNLFQNATALLRHRDDIELFLNEYVSHSNLKLQSVVADIQDKRIITSISVLAFFHVFLTEPYWKLMNSSKSYADFPFYVRKIKAAFAAWSSDDHDPAKSVSVFDDEFLAHVSDTSVVNQFFLSQSFHFSSFLSCLRKIVQECDAALNRQLSDFLDGGVFGGEIDDNVKSILSSCPLTNLTGERLFGDLDFCINKRRNASLHLRSTTNMWKHNKTAKWLKKQSPSVSQKLLKKAIKYGPEWKRRSRENKKTVNEKIKARIFENKAKKDEKAVKLAERKNAAIDAILGEGGCIVSTKEQLDVLFSGSKAVERLKDQIRFRSLVRGENITLGGNKAALYERLLQHISS